MTRAEIEIVKPDNAALLQLIDQLDADLLDRYPAEEVHGVDFQDPQIHEILFIVAYVDGQAVGCGAIRPLDSESVELKRFFVAPDYRNQGIAAQMLHFLEQRAVERKYQFIRLETGTMQPEANQFYEKHGYDEIAQFGMYVGSEYSICYEKRLG
ncbi:GNAT family N-acetyltransferase [Paenibacillus cremeus]|uniref:GNAT family N-acetyltransferase n=1 Tax=Paenibacillus cremeus TaxID=2163881 RepID=A0A559K6R6_9BACL|nr:GNAT family N-acetyltransferase [Paenibacillus cremeus]TVY07783.1 GNAT family N-acetyltransferase [Paenibacillus cremeus]